MAAAPRKRDSPRDPAKNTGVIWRRALLVSFLIIVLAAAVYGAQQVERYLIRDARFALTPPAEYGEESPALHVAGLKFASRAQVLRVFQQDVGRSVYLFPLASRRAALLRIPWVQEASILRTWPNQIVVQIAERQPVAFIEWRSESITRWSLIDREGVILEPPARTRFDLPVASGVRLDEDQNTRGVRVRHMLRMLDDLGPSRDRISEVDVSDLDDLKVTLKVAGRAIVLMLGDRNFRVRFQNFLDHYPDIQKRISDVSALDLRLDDRITVVGAGHHD